MRWYHVAAILLAITFPALAGPLPDGGVTAQEVVRVLQSKGLQAAITTGKDGDPLIHSASGGSKFGVYFYECKKSPRCGSIQFSAGFTQRNVSPARLADWNRGKRFGRVYLDDDFDPWVEMDMDMEHGATTEAIANNVERWVGVIGEFTKYIGR